MKKAVALFLVFNVITSMFYTVYCQDELSFEPMKREYSVAFGVIKQMEGDRVLFTDALPNEGTRYGAMTLNCSKEDLSKLPMGENIKIYYSNGRLLYYTKAINQKPVDVPMDEKVRFLKAVGILKGDEGGELNQQQDITRAEFISLLLRNTCNSNYGKSKDVFIDCANHWAKQEITNAYDIGIVRGISENEFAPDEKITFEQMVIIAVRFAGLEREVDTYGGYSKGYFEVAKKANIISKDDDSNTAPIRRNAESMIYNLCPHTPVALPAAGGMGGKPVIYLYPRKEQNVQVDLQLRGEFLFTYPEYKQGWNVTARPDGTILSEGKEYSYLFWEGTMPDFKVDFSQGFVVSREDTVPFLENILSKMGLLPKEYNEFIVYWAPKLQQNAYNKIYFAKEEYERNAELTIRPKPDSVLRVFMVWDKAEEGAVLPPQEVKPFERKGFTVIEWGGYER